VYSHRSGSMGPNDRKNWNWKKSWKKKAPSCGPSKYFNPFLNNAQPLFVTHRNFIFILAGDWPRMLAVFTDLSTCISNRFRCTSITTVACWLLHRKA